MNLDYEIMFNKMIIKQGWEHKAELDANRVKAGIDRYKTVEAKTEVPWFLIGCIHLLEGDCDFNTHLHNGDPLKKRTVHVPRGRPKTGNPPFTWEESAIDALVYDNVKPPLNTISEQLGTLERYNGMGYHTKGLPTPYLWSGSDQYLKGKYVSDGKFDPNAVSDQVGVAVIIKVLKSKDLI